MAVRHIESIQVYCCAFFFFLCVLRKNYFMLLKGKTALITGGTRGIGYAIVKKFAAEGCNIAFTYLSSAEKAQELEAELNKLGVKAKAYKSDASSYSNAEKLITEVITIIAQIDNIS